MSKTIKHATMTLACAVGLAACASTVELSRKNMLHHLEPLVALEEKHADLQQAIQLTMFFSQEVPDNEASKLKEHNDVYWVHHAAANVAVANGNMEGYEKHVEAAKREVEAMDAVLKDWSQALLSKQGKTVGQAQL